MGLQRCDLWEHQAEAKQKDQGFVLVTDALLGTICLKRVLAVIADCNPA